MTRGGASEESASEEKMRGSRTAGVNNLACFMAASFSGWFSIFSICRSESGGFIHRFIQ